jgi:hypothetical protein
MRWRVFCGFVASIVAVWLAAAQPAAATVYCTVLKSPDGFVALRAGPSSDAKLVAQMREGDEVLAMDGNKGHWWPVVHWRGDDRHHETRRSNTRKGWMHGRYMSDMCG